MDKLKAEKGGTGKGRRSRKKRLQCICLVQHPTQSDGKTVSVGYVSITQQPNNTTQHPFHPSIDPRNVSLSLSLMHFRNSRNHQPADPVMHLLINVSIHSSMVASIHRHIYLFVHPSVHFPIHPTITVSVHPPIDPSIHPHAFISICNRLIS